MLNIIEVSVYLQNVHSALHAIIVRTFTVHFIHLTLSLRKLIH